MSDTPKRCRCGAELPRRTTGRPATYCSKACRQAAHRARQRAQTAAHHATWLRASMVRNLDEALETLGQARLLLLAPLGDAERDTAAVTAAGGEDWHATPPTDWESEVEILAVRAGRQARMVADYLREHARSAAEHAQAAKLAGIRRPPAPELTGDETGAGSVADTAAAAAATKPGEVDRDSVFNAIEDLLMVVDVTTAAGSRLPDEISDAVAGPAGELAEAWAEQSGTGSLDRLTAAARRVIEAARPHEARWPATLATVVRIAEMAMAPLQDAAATSGNASRKAKRTTRHAAPIRREHEDGTECTHRISPSGKPREGEDCPGVARYTATCQATGCEWTRTAGIRASVEDAKRYHLQSGR